MKSRSSRSNGNTKVTIALQLIPLHCLQSCSVRLFPLTATSPSLSPSPVNKKYWKETWNSHFIFRLSRLLLFLCLSRLQKALWKMLIESNVAAVLASSLPLLRTISCVMFFTFFLHSFFLIIRLKKKKREKREEKVCSCARVHCDCSFSICTWTVILPLQCVVVGTLVPWKHAENKWLERWDRENGGEEAWRRRRRRSERREAMRERERSRHLQRERDDAKMSREEWSREESS